MTGIGVALDIPNVRWNEGLGTVTCPCGSHGRFLGGMYETSWRTYTTTS
jgi:hypothetical protein